MAADEKGRFYERIENRVNLNTDLRAGLREAILTNQTLKALVYIEMLFDELDGKQPEPKAETAKPKTTSKPKSTTTSTSTSTKSTPKKESEDKEDENKKD